MAQVVLTESDDGATLDVAHGDDVVIELPENPTTGYRWEIETDGDAVTSYDRNERSAIGGGGRRRVALRASKSGETVIRARLRRQWEPPEQSIKQHEFTIRVT